MSQKIKVQALSPEYMNKFKCIGSKCESTCCAGWTVHLDKETFHKYRNNKNIYLKHDFSNNIKRLESNVTDKTYGYIKMKDRFICPFLNEEKLCKIHSTLGEDYLSYTCSTYPRNYSLIDNVLEISATTSCPEIARIALLNPDKMSFEKYETDVNINVIPKKALTTKGNLEHPTLGNYLWELRFFIIETLQSREYELWERLAILGIFHQTLEELYENNRISKLPDLINDYIATIEVGGFDSSLKCIAWNNNIQLDFFKQIIEMRYRHFKSNSEMLECSAEFLKGVNPKNDSNDVQEFMHNYTSAYTIYFKPFIEKNSYILENYLVNYIFKNLTPHQPTKSVFENYILMILHYCIINMYLIGMSAYHKDDFNEKHVIKLIQAIAKTIEHDSSFISNILGFLKQNNYTTLSYILILLKYPDKSIIATSTK